MNRKNYKIPPVDTVFSLDKFYKKRYNERTISQKNKNIFDTDAFANAALDYLYSCDNRDKTRNFLKTTDFLLSKNVNIIRSITVQEKDANDCLIYSGKRQTAY